MADVDDGVQWGLSGRTVVVTGASSGMGEQTATLLGRLGANVVLQGRNEANLRAIADEVERSGGQALTVALDLEETERAVDLVAAATARFGAIHGLVLNASLFDPRPFVETTAAHLNRQWNTNVVSHYLIAQAAVPHMPEGSSMVWVSSTVAHAGFATCSAYAATKGAVEAVSRTLAMELAPAGIRVNTMAPGFFRTPMTIPSFEADPAYEESVKQGTPLKRLGRPEEAAATIAFLLSDLAPYIDGQTITIDGGWTAQ